MLFIETASHVQRHLLHNADCVCMLFIIVRTLAKKGPILHTVLHRHGVNHAVRASCIPLLLNIEPHSLENTAEVSIILTLYRSVIGLFQYGNCDLSKGRSV